MRWVLWHYSDVLIFEDPKNTFLNPVFYLLYSILTIEILLHLYKTYFISNTNLKTKSRITKSICLEFSVIHSNSPKFKLCCTTMTFGIKKKILIRLKVLFKKNQKSLADSLAGHKCSFCQLFFWHLESYDSFSLQDNSCTDGESQYYFLLLHHG